MERQIQCVEVWGGKDACDISVKLAGLRGECLSVPFEGGSAGGDIHFLSVCGMSILSKMVLADVSGHGAEVADVAQVIHEALLESIGSHDNSTMLRHVNDAFLRRRAGAFKFTTMVATIFDSRDRSVVYAYAGHPSMLHGKAATGRFSPVVPDGRRGGIPLGVLPGTEYAQHMVQTAPGDVLVLYTDAYTEAEIEPGGMLGEVGLCALLEEPGTLAPADLKEHLLARLGRAITDDASLLIFEVL